jgi:ethanolamine utilization protein EutN
MKIAKVIGNLVASIKTHSHENFKMMVVVPTDLEGKESGESFLAIDMAQAGIGDYVLVMEEGNGARQITGRKDGAIDAVIVGIIDYIESGGRQRTLG